MEHESTPAGHDGEHGISPLPEALAGLDAEARDAITQLIVFHREFPAWAVWLPYRGHPWIAVRPASARAAGPGLPLIWVTAESAAELDALMRRADAALAPG